MSKTEVMDETVSALPRIPASDVKKRGWRSIVRALRTEQALLVTNHGEPEAVIVPAEAYKALVNAAKQSESRLDSSLAELRRRFDERLAVLQQPDADAKLRSIMRQPAKLHGKVKAGSY